MIDYQALALSRIISQYRGDAKLTEFVRLWAELIENEFQIADDMLRLRYSIDDMEGVQLDIIGRVLVQPRPNVTPNIPAFFGYEGTNGAVGYDVAPYFDDGGGTGLVPAPDVLYRRLLKAKAAWNNTDSYIDSIIESAELITDTVDIELENFKDMSFKIWLSEYPDPFTQFVLDSPSLIPAPTGVDYKGWDYFRYGVFVMDMLTMVLEDDDPMQVWTDLGELSNDANQPTVALQPIYKELGVGALPAAEMINDKDMPVEIPGTAEYIIVHMRASFASAAISGDQVFSYGTPGDGLIRVTRNATGEVNLQVDTDTASIVSIDSTTQPFDDASRTYTFVVAKDDNNPSADSFAKIYIDEVEEASATFDFGAGFNQTVDDLLHILKATGLIQNLAIQVLSKTPTDDFIQKQITIFNK